MNSLKRPIRWLYLALGTAALLFAGILYGWSILKAPLAAEFGWSASALSLNFTLTMCFFCLGGILGGRLLRRLGLFLSCLSGAVLSGLGFFLTSLLTGRILLLYLTYGLLGGLGIGIAYNVLITAVNAWFSDRKGLCSGVLMMGFGASVLALGGLTDRLLQEIGWRGVFRALGAALFLVLLLAALFIRLPEKQAGSAQRAQSGGVSTPEMLRSASFRRLFLLLVFLVAVGNTVVSMARDLALFVGSSAAAATTLVGLLSVCNGLGRVLTGALFDRCGRRVTGMTANLVTIAAAGMMLAALLAKSSVLCAVALCLCGLSYGACPTICSAFTAALFGAEHFSSNFSVMNCNLIFASFIATLSSLIASSACGYPGAIVLLLTLSTAALFLNIRLSKDA